MIPALKNFYEQQHAKDLTALKRLYERHTEDCIRAAELTVDSGRREQYLKLARQWTEAAASLQASTKWNARRALLNRRSPGESLQDRGG
jgi:hypothetical protein